MTEEKIQSAVRYPSDFTDEEGEILEPIINELESYTIGRPRKRDLRELLNAIFYLNINRLSLVVSAKRLPSLQAR